MILQLKNAENLIQNLNINNIPTRCPRQYSITFKFDNTNNSTISSYLHLN